jgi:hypothetical protein
MSAMIFCSALSAAGRVTRTSTAPHKIDGAGEHGIADFFFNGRGFAGQIGFIGGGRAFENFRVHGKLRTGLDEQFHSGTKIFDRHFAFAP